ncbi:hypothetical protein [Pelomonas sp. Root1444]|uniref:hypothetical protein n=1 Tax=Pelomonas sp. Root1444 TaxID=1736464 RepID=UPI000703ACF0|nr:hypothetical protein [Pelomonas sp. Root1444]KQY80926.1 hypothetical protein ASD35_03505 [Pelomonas sp. Root1444]
MASEQLVFRTVYVDPDVDTALRAMATSEGIGKGLMFRRFLAAGLRKNRGRKLQPGRNDTILAMRAVYVPADLEGRVSVLAFKSRMGKTAVIRQLLRLGHKALAA